MPGSGAPQQAQKEHSTTNQNNGGIVMAGVTSLLRSAQAAQKKYKAQKTHR